MALGSLRLKAWLLLCAISLAPVAVVIAVLLDLDSEAVKTSQKQLQAAVLAEVAGQVMGVVQATQGDAEAVAAALAEAASSEGNTLAGAEAVVASRRAIKAARFEVPGAHVSSVIRAKGAPESEAPASTPELRQAADEHDVGFAAAGPGRATLVVPVRMRGQQAMRGYVTVAVDFSRLPGELSRLAAERFDAEQVKLLVADGARRVVASYGLPEALPGAETAAMPIWRGLPPDTQRTARMGVVSEFTEGGAPMVGAVETVEALGWAVAVWRPESVAYGTLERMREAGLAVAAGALLLALVAGSLAARAITAPILALTAQARLVGERRWRDLRLASSRRDELGELFRSMGSMAAGLEQGEAEIEREAKLRGDLGRFMSGDLVDAIVRGEHSLALGGKRQTVSVLFADVVAFTPLAESKPAEEVVALLNELFSVLTEVVFRHGGTVDKFIGDCIMAVWGAPLAADDHATRALAAAEDMMRFLETAEAGWRAKYGVEVRLGVGVNSGEAIVGNIGSDKRMEYTVIGDVVNVAARLEAIARPNQVLVADATYELAKGAFSMKLLGERRLTGRKKETKVYELETA